MPEPVTAPFGSWQSPITADLIVADTVVFDLITTDGSNIYWLEIRPRENGRGVIVKRSPDGTLNDVTPQGFQVGSRAHEYGGGAYTVRNGWIFFCNNPDQQVYMQEPGGQPVPITPASSDAASLRFADLIVDPFRHRLIAVCESHSTSGSQPVNSLVSIPIAGGSIKTLASGHDFYSSPKVSYDGAKLAWLSWDHPNMPWDGTELNVAQFDSDGSLTKARVVAGSASESIFQPEWLPDGRLLFVSDRTDWWNLYCFDGSKVENLCPMDTEFARGQWVFGMNTYTLAINNRIKLVCTFNRGAFWKIAIIDLDSLSYNEIESEYSDISWPKMSGDNLIFRGASPQRLSAIVSLDLLTGKAQTLKACSSVSLDGEFISTPEMIEYPTSDNERAYALYYAPRNGNFVGPPNQKPPLIVKSHGGPISSLTTALNLEVQYWTSRGFAFVDVNYRGSTGYGRRYREKLYGKWGIADVDDCTNAALHLAATGRVNQESLLICGRSASGLTALCALTFKDAFCAGASYYGISDLVAIAQDTHKFELHIADRLIGPYPERKDVYIARSPINHFDQINCPIIFFQGLQDNVVPASQTQAMFDALKSKGLPVACLIFSEERHGFRRAETIKRALEGELYFYSRILKFTSADSLPALKIENLDKQAFSH